MRLHLHEWGDQDAPPLVCLHGVTGHGRRFRKLAEERLASRFRVLAPDLRGHGRSIWEPPWNLDTHLADVLETVSLERASWVGHSFGGRLVMELAAREPERVERAVLLDPAIQLAGHVALDLADDMRKELAFGSIDEAIDERIESSRLFRAPRELLEEEMREHLTPSDDGLLRYRYSQAAVAAAYGELAKPPPWPARVPTLLVIGVESHLVLEEQVETYQAAVGEALRVETVPGGHTVLWDAFAETAGAVERFLADRA